MLLERVPPLILMESVKIVPVVLANDGTALKPSIQFDQTQQVNIGLTETVNYTFIKAHQQPDPDFLRNHVMLFL